MDVKVGDIVRFLDDVGGGRVIKICERQAYVEDEDGFERIVPLRQCVVVNHTLNEHADLGNTNVEGYGIHPKPSTPRQPEFPTIEVPGGNTINAVFAFVPQDIKSLSTTDFDISFVNDSNYCLYITISNKSTAADEWSLLYHGLIEPNIQEPIGELKREQINSFERVTLQVVAFKKDKPFEMKAPASVELKIDTTKFFKLHCFRQNIYFDEQVLAFDILKDDKAVRPLQLDPETIRLGILGKESKPELKPISRSSKPTTEPLVIDLHDHVLLDTIAGLSPSDILNYQLDYFRHIMDEHRRHIGLKIIFIHGKGNGVLRDKLRKELEHRYKGCDVQDASFLEYGYGATQVTIKR